MRDAIDEGTAEPRKENVKQERGWEWIEHFNQIITYGVSIGGFSAIYMLAKDWLRFRRNCEVVLKFPDGSEVKLSDLSEKKALEIIQEHQEKMK